MIVAISINQNFIDYKKLYKVLKNVEKLPEFIKFIGPKCELLNKYLSETHGKIELWSIPWNELSGATNIKTNKFGKQYNADAPKILADDIARASTHIIEFGGGEFYLSKSKDKLESIVLEELQTEKRYKF